MKLNPFRPDFRLDPYPIYHQLREVNPVHRSLGMWVLTRHADVMNVLRDKTFSARSIPIQVHEQAQRTGLDGADRIERLAEKSLVFTDNPEHARLRGLVNRVFTGPSIAALRPRIAVLASALVQRAWAAGGLDVIAELAGPLPITVLCDWMDLPGDIRAQAGDWTRDIRFLLEPGLMRPADLVRVRDVVETFTVALEAVVAARRVAPGDDLVSALAAARTNSGDRLSDEEVAFVCMMCFIAGTETTKALVGNMVWALLTHEAQHRLLRANPGLAGAAVEETLRFESPLQQTKRLATVPTTVAGERVAPGNQVLLCLAAANRDPAVFERPDEFDLSRNAKVQVAFGYGMHGCLGGALASLQAELVAVELYKRPETLELVHTEPQWQDQSLILRGLARLEVNVR